MRSYFVVFIFSLVISTVSAQTKTINDEFNPSAMYPFGRPNPQAAQQITDFEELIGICNCESIRRNSDGSWQDSSAMVWKFKYIMNGLAIQDETWNADGSCATSIRRFNPDSLNWVVSYYGSRAVPNTVSIWLGKRVNDQIILKMPQKAPNGTEGTSRLTFYDISNNGFKWKGEWVSLDGSIVYPFWKIYCNKRNN